MDTAVALVIEKGYEDVMVDDISELADIGRRTFYNYFDNKRDCVVDAIKMRFRNYADEMNLIAKDASTKESKTRDDKMALAIMASHMFQLIAHDPVTPKLAAHPKILNEAITESQRESMMANVALGVMSGVFKPSLPVEIIEPILSWGFMGLVFDSIKRQSQSKDSYQWAHFILKNLEVDQHEIDVLLEQLANHTS